MIGDQAHLKLDYTHCMFFWNVLNGQMATVCCVWKFDNPSYTLYSGLCKIGDILIQWCQ